MKGPDPHTVNHHEQPALGNSVQVPGTRKSREVTDESRRTGSWENFVSKELMKKYFS